ncbi:hypothetical protein E2C01_089107 [Portunus trituberculatus]|uniref:Uncharacterized protein n=1 Tax=Portunus trituberculatus TaxID=210409 RepID=A0A5B7JGD5_PORTR|nr:hypothetical protein [Portunus trituberculatus]
MVVVAAFPSLPSCPYQLVISPCHFPSCCLFALQPSPTNPPPFYSSTHRQLRKYALTHLLEVSTKQTF